MEKPKKQLLSAEKIPIDLLITICSTLPAKSIARFRCVSKEWSSILRRRDFTDLHLKMSSSRRSLLFTFKLNGKWLFFSVPQPLNPDQISSPLVADRYMSFDTEDYSYGVSQPVCGLLCSRDTYPIVFNPSTGNYVTLPKVASSSTVTTLLGYDPIDNLFKVFRVADDYQILTLGNGEPSWRIIKERIIPHYVAPGGICINGVLFYIAASTPCGGIRCKLSTIGVYGFDVRSEDFNFFSMGSMFTLGTSLINCKGKLGAVLADDPYTFYTKKTTKLELWVLDDVETEEWSGYLFELPPSWKNLVGDAYLYISGMTSTGEIVFSPAHHLHDVPFYIFYYNLVRNTVARVEIQLGMVVPEGYKIHTFIDHVEDLKLLEVLGSS